MGCYPTKPACQWGNTPWWIHRCMGYAPRMKTRHYYQDQNQKPAGAAHVASAGELNQDTHDSRPSAADVAARAYASFVHQGSLHGNHERHWLEAEAKLIQERTLTRTHGYPNRK